MTEAELAELKRRLRRERVERARLRHPIDKFFAGVRLFEMWRRGLRMAVQLDMPGADDALVDEEVRRIIDEIRECDEEEKRRMMIEMRDRETRLR